LTQNYLTNGDITKFVKKKSPHPHYVHYVIRSVIWLGAMDSEQ